jgi:hypothetical protein
VAKDSSSVVIRSSGIFDEDELMHIHFEDNGYWIASWGDVIEHFRRIA